MQCCAVLLSLLVVVAARGHGLQTCWPPFGCFPWHSDFVSWSRRPYNPDPQGPEELRVEVYLFARWLPRRPGLEGCGQSEPSRWGRRSGQQPCIILTGDLLRPSRLRAKLTWLRSVRDHQNEHLELSSGQQPQSPWIAVIVHGFHTDSHRSTYALAIKDKLLANRNGRQYEMVLVVDWGPGCSTSYPQACSNARLVANELAWLLRQCLERLEGTAASRIHLIGHSLGAHLAGYVGKNFTADGPEPIGRITGLDPAGPYFDGLSARVRLDRTDAELVDVIHTNGKPSPHFSLGISNPIGHLDFFPNGGHHQPGCHHGSRSVLPIAAQLFRSDSCDHYRAAKLFLNSIPAGGPACPFRAVRCASWKSYERDQCPAKYRCEKIGRQGTGCAQMGFFAYDWAERNWPEKQPGQFYLRTLGHSPFCRASRSGGVLAEYIAQRPTGPY